MQVRYYGLYDSCAKEYVRTFTSKNDETAQRAAEYIVRESNFDRIAGRDYVINYLYSFESDSGLIVDNSIHVICSLGQALAAFEAEEKEKHILSRDELMKALNDSSFVDGLKKDLLKEIKKYAKRKTI